ACCSRTTRTPRTSIGPTAGRHPVGELSTAWPNSNAHCQHQNDADAGHQNSQRRSVVFEPSPILTKLIHDGKPLLRANSFLGPNGPVGSLHIFTCTPDFALIRLH